MIPMRVYSHFYDAEFSPAVILHAIRHLRSVLTRQAPEMLEHYDLNRRTDLELMEVLATPDGFLDHVLYAAQQHGFRLQPVMDHSGSATHAPQKGFKVSFDPLVHTA